MGQADAGPHIAFSTDNGATWSPGTDPSGASGGGTVAASADGGRFVWSPEGAGVHRTGDSGASWSAAQGIPAGAIVESDREDPDTFYGFKTGRFYVSTDGGATFEASPATGLPAGDSVRFKALPGRAGEIWLAGGAADGPYGLWHSTDFGQTFTEVAGVDEADTVGFGKAAPGASYPTLFTSARIDGVRGIYRSTDAGASWVRVNDDAHQWGWTGAAVTGDPRVFGRVYVATNGRGVVYGDPADPGGGTDPDPSGACEVAYRVTNTWGDGFQADVRLTNTGTTPWDGWSLAWSFAGGERIAQLWNGAHTQSGRGGDGPRRRLEPAGVAPGASVPASASRELVGGERGTALVRAGGPGLRSGMTLREGASRWRALPTP
ncbi:Xyloglucanase OS=Streptomyces tendae OX=1932 GN=GUR47_01550 PE=3 SV=1 [Streptomyces tendae]